MKRKKIRSNNKGFTLIELIASFTILSVIAVTLFQMFSAAKKINERAYQTDKADIMAINLIESFRKDPECIFKNDFFAENEDETQNYTFLDKNNNIAVKFFDNSLNPLIVEKKDSLQKNFYSPVPPFDAKFIVTAQLTDEMEEENYSLINPDAFIVFNIKKSFGYNLLIEAVPSGSGEEMVKVSLKNAVFSMMTLDTEIVPMQKVIENGMKLPIRVIFTGNPLEGSKPVNCYINVINKPDIDLQLFIHANNTVFAGVEYSMEDIIDIKPLEGTCSVIYPGMDIPYVKKEIKKFRVNISRIDDNKNTGKKLLEFSQSVFVQKKETSVP